MSHVSHDADRTSRETDHVTTANNRDLVVRTTTDLHEHDQRLQRNLNSVSINQRTAAIVAPGALKSPSPQSWPLVTHPTHAVHQSLSARRFTPAQNSDPDRSSHHISSQAVHQMSQASPPTQNPHVAPRRDENVYDPRYSDSCLEQGLSDEEASVNDPFLPGLGLAVGDQALKRIER